MDRDICRLSVDEENTQIVISGLVDFTIDYSGDIEFTQFITVLAKRIDVGIPVDFEQDEVSDEKICLVVDTIKSIFEKYNESIKIENAAELTAVSNAEVVTG